MEQLDLESNWTESGVGGVVCGFFFFFFLLINKTPNKQTKIPKKNPKKNKPEETLPGQHPERT